MLKKVRHPEALKFLNRFLLCPCQRSPWVKAHSLLVRHYLSVVNGFLQTSVFFSTLTVFSSLTIYRDSICISQQWLASVINPTQPQMKDCFYQVGPWAWIWRIVLISSTDVRKDLAHCGQHYPKAVGPRKIMEEWRKQASRPGLCAFISFCSQLWMCCAQLFEVPALTPHTMMDSRNCKL